MVRSKVFFPSFAGAKLLKIGVFASIFLAACGGDDKKETSNEDFKTGAVEFPEDSKGQQYVLMPYVTGDVNKIEGGSETLTFSVKGTTSQASKLTEEVEESFMLKTPKTQPVMSWMEINHSLRTLLNRFDPSLGYYQGEWFWNLAKSIDHSLMTQANGSSDASKSMSLYHDAISAYFDSEDPVGPVESQYLASIGASIPSAMSPFVASNPSPELNLIQGDTLLNSSACPKAGETVWAPKAASPSEVEARTIPEGGAVESADYCIAYISAPVSEPNKDQIKKSIETILKVYKKVVYKSEFETTASGFVFKPIIVVLDFKNASLWPQIAAYQVDGAYLPIPSAKANRPMLYMASDLAAVKSRDATLVKSQFHSTIAHEIQHAIMAYFRIYKTQGTAELPSLDEGLAHYMEDLFGYGEENFPFFAKQYFDVWMDNANPAIHVSESIAVNRGASQALWYYLTTKKGGVTFTDGLAAGGDGLKFIADVVTNAKVRGPKGLSEKFGGDWTVTIGEFFAAMAVDNSTAVETNEKFKLKELQSMTDLQGRAKKFGMRFNNFGGRSAIRNFSESKFASGENVDLTYYATLPLFYEVTDPSTKISFTTTTDQGTVAVARVRLK